MHSNQKSFLSSNSKAASGAISAFAVGAFGAAVTSMAEVINKVVYEDNSAKKEVSKSFAG